MHERRGRRMKCRAAKPAQDQYEGEYHGIRSEPDQRQDDDAEDRSGEQQDSRTPAIGDMAECELTD